MSTPRPPSLPPSTTFHPPPAGAAPTRVLLVDDHDGLREALRSILDQQPDFRVCGCAAAVPEALHLARARRPRVAVLDLFLEEGNGLELARLLRLLNPTLGLVFFTMHTEAGIVRRAAQLGALGFVGKDEPLPHLLQALHCARRGLAYQNALLAPHLEAAADTAPATGKRAGGDTPPLHLLPSSDDDPFDISPWRRRPRR